MEPTCYICTNRPIVRRRFSRTARTWNALTRTLEERIVSYYVAMCTGCDKKYPRDD